MDDQKNNERDEEQRTEMTKEQQEVVDRVAIVLHGAKAIAEYMGVSPATISRWRTRFRGQEEVRLCFPAIVLPTGKGWAFRMIAHTGLIKEWMERWAEIDCAMAQEKAKRRRRPQKVKRIGETRQLPGRPIEKKRVDLPREELRVQVENRPESLPGPPINQPVQGIQRPEGCTCGTGLNCDACNKPC
jgi:Homeodomain-like domain